MYVRVYIFEMKMSQRILFWYQIVLKKWWLFKKKLQKSLFGEKQIYMEPPKKTIFPPEFVLDYFFTIYIYNIYTSHNHISAK